MPALRTFHREEFRYLAGGRTLSVVANFYAHIHRAEEFREIERHHWLSVVVPSLERWG